MKVGFETENSALDLHLILDMIATQQKSANVNSSVTLALLPGKTNIVRIRFLIPILASQALDLIATPAFTAERALSVCVDMCAGKCNRMSINLEQRVYSFSANKQEILVKCSLQL